MLHYFDLQEPQTDEVVSGNKIQVQCSHTFSIVCNAHLGLDTYCDCPDWHKKLKYRIEEHWHKHLDKPYLLIKKIVKTKHAQDEVKEEVRVLLWPTLPYRKVRSTEPQIGYILKMPQETRGILSSYTYQVLLRWVNSSHVRNIPLLLFASVH